jgi:hypothetical protein
VTAVAQWLKTPGIHCYVAGPIPAVTPRYSTNKIRNALWSTKKKKKKKKLVGHRGQSGTGRINFLLSLLSVIIFVLTFSAENMIHLYR